MNKYFLIFISVILLSSCSDNEEVENLQSIQAELALGT